MWCRQTRRRPTPRRRGSDRPGRTPRGTVIQRRPAPLRQRVRHDGPDRVLPVTGRRHVRRLVRCFVSQPGTGNQALAEIGSPNASRNKGFEPKTHTETRKRAAGIEPASSAWKAEVLPLNYARTSTTELLCQNGSC